jgi:phenylglyoxylate dehydrogenase epsilon subunit
MPRSKYLILGASHAGLEAAAAIRLHDATGTLTMLTRDSHLPYSPTILPYVVSGRSRPDNIFLRDETYFAKHRVALVRGATVVAVDTDAASVRTDTGAEWQYERLLLATGAAPAVPPVAGLDEVPFHVLRTLDDALRLRDAIGRAESAVVLGAGLVGMHAAENLTKCGVGVTVIEKEPHALSGYFTAAASAIIEQTFAAKGVRMRMGRTLAAAARQGRGCTVTLDDGSTLAADLLLICTGVKPALAHLDGSGVATDRGILVDDRMRTNVANLWAAGDAAQAPGFWGGTLVSGILPSAVQQGGVAGADMAEDRGAKPFSGAVPLNTYRFFDRHAISVGMSAANHGDPDLEIDEIVDEDRATYRRIVLKEGRLVGIATVNGFVDPGIMWQLILRRVDLAPLKPAFLARPRETGRLLMSRIWR